MPALYYEGLKIGNILLKCRQSTEIELDLFYFASKQRLLKMLALPPVEEDKKELDEEDTGNEERESMKPPSMLASSPSSNELDGQGQAAMDPQSKESLEIDIPEVAEVKTLQDGSKKISLCLPGCPDRYRKRTVTCHIGIEKLNKMRDLLGPR